MFRVLAILGNRDQNSLPYNFTRAALNASGTCDEYYYRPFKDILSKLFIWPCSIDFPQPAPREYVSLF
jgi:hypothetical protein